MRYFYDSALSLTACAVIFPFSFPGYFATLVRVLAMMCERWEKIVYEKTLSVCAIKKSVCIWLKPLCGWGWRSFERERRTHIKIAFILYLYNKTTFIHIVSYEIETG